MTVTLRLPQPERYERGYRARLQAQLPGALAAVMSYWVAEGDPVDLPAIVSWPEGPIPTDALTDYIDTFPAVGLEVTSFTPADDAGTIVLDSLVVHYYGVDAPTPAEAHKVCVRSILAIAELLLEKPLDLQIKDRGKLSIYLDPAESPAPGSYLKIAHVTLPLRIVGTL